MAEVDLEKYTWPGHDVYTDAVIELRALFQDGVLLDEEAVADFIGIHLEHLDENQAIWDKAHHPMFNEPNKAVLICWEFVNGNETAWEELTDMGVAHLRAKVHDLIKQTEKDLGKKLV